MTSKELNKGINLIMCNADFIDVTHQKAVTYTRRPSNKRDVSLIYFSYCGSIAYTKTMDYQEDPSRLKVPQSTTVNWFNQANFKTNGMFLTRLIFNWLKIATNPIEANNFLVHRIETSLDFSQDREVGVLEAYLPRMVHYYESRGKTSFHITPYKR